MPYDAITFDANTVFHNGFHFEGGMLAQMNQFKHGPTKFVLSEIVVREIVRNLTVKTKATRESLETSLKKALEAGLLTEELQNLASQIGAMATPREAARSRFEKFFKNSGCSVVMAERAAMKDLVHLYFRPRPPFEASGKKKNEFPDAIALLSIQNWAEESGLKLLAVSDDAGWASFADEVDCIDVVNDLGTALQLLQTHTEQATSVVKAKFFEVTKEPNNALAQGFNSHLSDAVSRLEPHGTAEAAYAVDVDEVQLTLEDFAFDYEPEGEPFDIVQIGARKIVARVELQIQSRAAGSFSFDLWDSIDREYVNIGGAHAEVQYEFEANALVTLEGDWAVNPDSVEVTAIELVDVPEVDFGYVEPDYSDLDQED